MDGFGRGPGLTGATMTPEKVCSICHGTIVGFGNIAEPINSGRCCDRRYWEKVVPERCGGCKSAMPSRKASFLAVDAPGDAHRCARATHHLASARKSLARNRKSCTGVAATKGTLGIGHSVMPITEAAAGFGHPAPHQHLDFVVGVATLAICAFGLPAKVRQRQGDLS
jgi:hypothetical protein